MPTTFHLCPLLNSLSGHLFRQLFVRKRPTEQHTNRYALPDSAIIVTKSEVRLMPYLLRPNGSDNTCPTHLISGMILNSPPLLRNDELPNLPVIDQLHQSVSPITILPHSRHCLLLETLSFPGFSMERISRVSSHYPMTAMYTISSWTSSKPSNRIFRLTHKYTAKSLYPTSQRDQQSWRRLYCYP
jgi:hypothetical protein